jgi:uncharacterized membrane protein
VLDSHFLGALLVVTDLNAAKIAPHFQQLLSYQHDVFLCKRVRLFSKGHADIQASAGCSAKFVNVFLVQNYSFG